MHAVMNVERQVDDAETGVPLQGAYFLDVGLGAGDRRRKRGNDAALVLELDAQLD